MLRGSNKQTINKEKRSTTKDAVKRVMDGRRALTTMGSTGNNKIDDNTFGCPGATGVARPRTAKNKTQELNKGCSNKLH